MASQVDKLTSQLADTHVKPPIGKDEEVSFAGEAIKMNCAGDADTIVEEINNCERLLSLRLEGNTMGVEAAEVIGKALEKHPEFQRARWSDMFTGRMKTEIPPALKFLGTGIIASGASLVELDLSDNAFGPVGVEGISELLRSSSCYNLEELKLNNNGLGPNGGKMLATVLNDTYEASCKAGKPLALKMFVSGRGRLENEGSKALSEVFKKMGSLEFVSMPQNGINPPGILALADAFKSNTNLKHLNLCDNTFTVQGAEAWAKTLPHLTKLEELNFESCLVRSKGAKVLAKALKGSFPGLKKVMFNYNEIGTPGAVALCETVGQMDSVTELQLDGNCLGEDGKELVMETLDAIDKAYLVPSLEEDEGTDEEDDDDEEGGEQSEDDTEGDELNDSQLQIKGKALPIREPAEKVSPAEYVDSPSQPRLRGLDVAEWTAYCRDKLSPLSDDSDFSDQIIYLCMKLAVPLNTTDISETHKTAFKLCDAVFDAAGQTPSSGVLCNSILVNLGLLKSENKKFKVATDALTGPLLVVEYAIKQEYFPKGSFSTLSTFLTHSEKKLEKFFTAKHKLLQTLFNLS